MLTDSTSARKAVLVSLVALLGIAYYRTAQGENTGSVYRRLWGVGVLGVALSVLADFAPAIAGPFAVLTVLGSLTNGGDQALQQILGKVSGGAPVSSGGASYPGNAAQVTRNTADQSLAAAVSGLHVAL